MVPHEIAGQGRYRRDRAGPEHRHRRSTDRPSLHLGCRDLDLSHALQKLSAALDKSPDSAAAYGIIAGNGRAGLSSYLPFEAARLTEHDYLAAVAMIRRQVWEDIGGYGTQVSHRGYEDYEFWLGLAGNGCGAEFLPQFVGRLRAESAPRRQVEVETAPLMSELRELYPLLPWGQS